MRIARFLSAFHLQGALHRFLSRRDFLVAGLCAVAFAAGLGPLPAQAADAPPAFPLPLAKNAKLKPDPFPEERYQHELDATYVRMVVLIGARDYDTLEKTAADWLAQYQAKKMSGDQYIDHLNTLAPSKGGDNMVADTQAWVQARPQSYAARYALGRLYHDLAWKERGARYASQTTDAQFVAMYRYAALSETALQQSLALTRQPLATYSTLIRVAAISNKPRSGDPNWRALLPGQSFCPGKYAADGLYANRREEQIYYLCQALRLDPDALLPFGNMVFFNSPRWAGNYDVLDKLYAEIEGARRSSPRALGGMRAKILAIKADDAFRDGKPGAASEFYVAAFHAAPAPENVHWMYKAAQYERYNTKNLDRSRVLYSEIVAYRDGEAYAIANVAWIDEERGDLRNYLQAMTNAGYLGMKEAQNNLGYYYMVGQRGLPRDLQQARAWLTLAANQGYEHAREKVGVVEGMIAAEAKGK